METSQIFHGDALTVLKTLPDRLVHCCATSPPYWNLRDYGAPGQLGLESTPEEYVTNMVEVFREVRRVLRDDGTLWLNLGDSYASDTKWGGTTGGKHAKGLHGTNFIGRNRTNTGLKPKDLVGIPWRVAFALQADGWFLRSDIIWHKPNPMPESVIDRPTKSHEYLFLLSKSRKYYYDHEAIKEPTVYSGTNNGVGFGYGTDAEKRSRDRVRGSRGIINNKLNSELRKSGNIERKLSHKPGCAVGTNVPWEGNTRNKRTVWTISTKPFPEAHFATFPPKLIEPCILAGCPGGGITLDPFIGAGTIALVAIQLGRNYLGIELNPEYIALAEKRISEVQIKIPLSGG